VPDVKFLVCALFYGDFPQLAERCARSLRLIRATGRVDMRIGLNEVSARSKQLIDALLPGVERIEAQPQLYKYPMMRRLVHGYGGDATHLMWFDDDSCINEQMDVGEWLRLVGMRAAMTEGTTGSVYRYTLAPHEQAWVRSQPWYTGRPIEGPTHFNLGAWFMAPLSLFRRFDWPPVSLRHNGGDSALGALCWQQGLPVLDCRGGVAISADDTLAEFTAPRRGFSEPNLGLSPESKA
jgi:hypothetical protein